MAEAPTSPLPKAVAKPPKAARGRGRGHKQISSKSWHTHPSVQLELDRKQEEKS